jgi:hypothetical protein
MESIDIRVGRAHYPKHFVVSIYFSEFARCTGDHSRSDGRGRGGSCSLAFRGPSGTFQSTFPSTSNIFRGWRRSLAQGLPTLYLRVVSHLSPLALLCHLVCLGSGEGAAFQFFIYVQVSSTSTARSLSMIPWSPTREDISIGSAAPSDAFEASKPCEGRCDESATSIEDELFECTTRVCARPRVRVLIVSIRHTYHQSGRRPGGSMERGHRHFCAIPGAEAITIEHVR